ncbi:unnamed protein product [Gulo gulo]|uniref:Uncharacterized protein n=1 Tax=Gulo gulo TaxID=48420 RepID=A0A9X9PY31_GULGU|nr:unnamed protein product [Gulo gulo]
MCPFTAVNVMWGRKEAFRVASVGCGPFLLLSHRKSGRRAGVPMVHSAHSPDLFERVWPCAHGQSCLPVPQCPQIQCGTPNQTSLPARTVLSSGSLWRLPLPPGSEQVV